jgi:Circadian oscillating protein COP23
MIMKKLLALTVLVTGAIALFNTSQALTQPAPSRVMFFCRHGHDPEVNQSVPTTFAQHPQQRKTAIIRWKSGQLGQWEPIKRCEAVSPRFQTAYDKGTLNYLTYGWINRQRVICSTRDYGGPCEELLFTLKAEDNPVQVLNQLNSILGGNASSVLNQNTGQSQVYIRFDVDAFLKQASAQE